MNDQLAQSLATLIGTLSTVALMAGTYYWGPRKREERRDSRERDDEYRRNDDNRRHTQRDYDGPDHRHRYYDDQDDEGDSR